jgi:predicted thioredoxin/glutaredoxin
MEEKELFLNLILHKMCMEEYERLTKLTNEEKVKIIEKHIKSKNLLKYLKGVK